MLLVPYIYKQVHYVKLSEIKQYVKDNREYMTDIAGQLLKSQNEPIEGYKYAGMLPQRIDANKLYSDIRIREVVVYKNYPNLKDTVQIILKDKNGNFSCGIYYSPDNVLLHHGKPQEGDKYEYNNEYHDRHIYRSEKICDYWYYYEDDTWN